MDEKRGTGALRAGVTSAIADAVFAELASVGYARASMEAVARRAGAGKAALYRRWSSKEEMVLDVIATTVRSHLLAAPERGDLETDLRVVLTGLLAQLGHPAVARIAPGLLAEATVDDRFRGALWAAVAEPRRAVVQQALSAAVDRGELPADLDMGLAADLIVAPLAMRLLFVHGPADDDYFEALLSSVHAAVRAAHAPTHRPS